MRCSWISPSAGPLDPHRLRDAVHAVVHPASAPGGPLLRPVRRAGADHPGRSRGAPGSMSNLDADDVDVDEQIQRVCAAERAAVCDLADQPAFRAALIRTGDRSAPVCADQSPHRAGRLVAADPAAGDIRQLLRAAAARAGRRIAGSSPGWPSRDRDAARAAWARGAGRLRHPHPGRPAGPVGAGAARRRIVSGARARPPGPSASWRARATPPSTPCCRPPGRSCCAG